MVICLGYFRVLWVKMRGDCLFCWYWWNCWLSLIKLSFHNNFWRTCVSFASDNLKATLLQIVGNFCGLDWMNCPKDCFTVNKVSGCPACTCEYMLKLRNIRRNEFCCKSWSSALLSYFPSSYIVSINWTVFKPNRSIFVSFSFFILNLLISGAFFSNERFLIGWSFK